MKRGNGCCPFAVSCQFHFDPLRGCSPLVRTVTSKAHRHLQGPFRPTQPRLSVWFRHRADMGDLQTTNSSSGIRESPESQVEPARAYLCLLDRRPGKLSRVVLLLHKPQQIACPGWLLMSLAPHFSSGVQRRMLQRHWSLFVFHKVASPTGDAGSGLNTSRRAVCRTSAAALQQQRFDPGDLDELPAGLNHGAVGSV